MFRYLLFFVLVLFFNNQLYACSCNCFQTDIPLEEIDGLLIAQKKEKNSAVIFEGQLRSFEIQEDQLKLTFEVQRYYKGDKQPTSISILTSRGDCGFRAAVGHQCLIFAYDYNGALHTTSSQCSRSVALEQEQEKYNQYKRFLDVMIDKPNGTHGFKRFKKHPYACKPLKGKIVAPLNLKFTIKNNQLDGEWWLYDSNGEVLERGIYKQGLRFGEWLIKNKKIRFAALKPD